MVEPLPLAVHATQCPYMQAMVQSLKAWGIKTRIVMESSSTPAVKVFVEAEPRISVIDRAKVTDRMQILRSLPLIPELKVILAGQLTRERIRRLTCSALRCEGISPCEIIESRNSRQSYQLRGSPQRHRGGTQSSERMALSCCQ